MRPAFWLQHWFTPLSAHSALLREARIGFPFTMTKTGFVCAAGIIRAATQLLALMGTSNFIARGLPSASNLCEVTGLPFTMISTATSRLSPIPIPESMRV